MTPRRLIEPARLAGSTLLRTQTDSRLIDLVRAGHASAFEAIVQRYRRPLLAYCSRVLPEGRAEDAVQQAFLSAYQAMTRDEADLNLRPWLYRIAHNASLNLLRQNGWSYDQLNDQLDGVERPEQALERRESLRSTLDAVKSLPERQRDALVLRELEGLSYDEIAATLGVGDGAVRQLLHRARATLRAGASALTPVGLLERLVTASPGADVSGRIAEVAAGVGGGVGVAKVGAALIATGAIATGTLATPIVRHHHHSRATQASAASAPHPESRPTERATTVAVAQTVVVHHHRSAKRRSEGSSGQSTPHRSDRSGPSGSDDGKREPEHRSGDHSRSGPSGSDDGEHHSGTNVNTTTPPTSDHSGSDDSSPRDGTSADGSGGGTTSASSGTGSGEIPTAGSPGPGAAGSGGDGSDAVASDH